jgi:hypothetical protein
MSRGIDIIVVHDGPERGAHIQYDQRGVFSGLMPYTASLAWVSLGLQAPVLLGEPVVL